MKAHLAKDVRHGLKVGAAAQERPDCIKLGGRDRPIVVQIQLKSIEVEHTADQLLGVQAGGRDSLRVEIRCRQRDDVLDVLHAPGHGLSHRRRRPQAAGGSSRPAARN